MNKTPLINNVMIIIIILINALFLPFIIIILKLLSVYNKGLPHSCQDLENVFLFSLLFILT